MQRIIEVHQNPELSKAIGYAKVDAFIDHGRMPGDIKDSLVPWIKANFPHRTKNAAGTAKMIVELKPPKYLWPRMDEVLQIIKTGGVK